MLPETSRQLAIEIQNKQGKAMIMVGGQHDGEEDLSILFRSMKQTLEKNS
jgi:hypothetical protein